MRWGVDYAFDRPSSLTSLRAARVGGGTVTFVCRYFAGGHGGSKELTATEAKALSSAGLDIVVVWETSAGRARQGGAAGAADARAALEQAKRVGMPSGRPIYFAVDEDVEGAAVWRYFDAVKNVVGVPRAGVYGSYKVCKYLLDKGYVKWAWQTYAWSAGQWDTRAQLQQYSNGHTVAGADADYNRAMVADFGQWRVGQAAPKPQPQGSAFKFPTKDFQMWSNTFVKAKKLPVAPLHVDDEDGPATRARVEFVKLALGYTKKYANWQITDQLLRQLQHPLWRSLFSPIQWIRGLRWRSYYRHTHGRSTRAGLAQQVLSHRNSVFAFVSPTGGSARVGLQQQAEGHLAHVYATGGNVNIDTRVLAYCLDLCQYGSTYINCIVNGRHMSGSQHYSGTAVDIDKHSGSGSHVWAVAGRHGLTVLNEDAYHWHVHV